MAKKRKKRKKRYCGIGGQAVLEGVMMKNQDRYAVAVRKPDGTIAVQAQDYTGIRGAKKVAKIPFIRGIFNFVDSLVLGMKSLTWSAEFYEDEGEGQSSEEAQENAQTGSDVLSHDEEMPQRQVQEAEQDKADAGKSGKGAGDSLVMGATILFSVVMAVAIFIVLPYFISTLFSAYICNASLMAILEGVLRILIFLGYVLIISSMKDIRRVYMYHGAEHKCINCLERGRELTVKNVRKSSRQHRRCGTSFLLFVMVISVILFLFIRVENPLLRLGARLLLVPVIAGISYEVIRLAGKSENIFVRIISAPGMWLQKLTTREPDDDMIEVAIASVEAIFDWKKFLKESFGYDIEAWEREEREQEEPKRKRAAEDTRAAGILQAENDDRPDAEAQIQAVGEEES